MKRTLVFLLLIASLIQGSMFAQVLDPVSWSFTQKKKTATEYELLFSADIDDKWHLYALDLPEGGPIPTSFTFDPSDDYELVGGVTELTEAEVKYDASFDMDLGMFSGQAVFKQVIRAAAGNEFTLSGSIEFMSCDDERCLPPRDEPFSFLIGSAQSQVPSSEGETQAGEETDVDQLKSTISIDTEDDASTSSGNKEDKSLWGLFLVSFLLGFAGVLTPCVFPMIPMTVTFFLQGSEHRGKAISKALIFGLSIVAIYTSIGLIISLTSAGADFANVLSTHWIPNIIFFVLFMAFAASFFGLFEIILPSNLTNKADKQADKGGLLAAFFMALTLTLVSFSCTGPIVGALLVQAATGDVIEPTIGMFGFSLAFALPFTLLAIFPSWLKNLPKSGGWLNSVKVVMGFIVLAFAFKFLSNVDQTYHWGILGRDIYLAIWIVLFILLGFYLLGKIRFSHDSELSYITVPRLVLIIASFSFAVYMIPGLFGAPLKGISGLIPPMTSQSFNLPEMIGSRTVNPGDSSYEDPSGICETPKYGDFLELPHGLEGYYEYEQGMACARKQNKPVFLDFKGHTCSNCKEMEAKVWSDPDVLRILRNDYLIIALYTDDRTKLPEEEWITSAYDGKVKKTMGKKNLDIQISRFNTNTQPLYALVDHKGNPLTSTMQYNLDIGDFIEFLEAGKRAFNEKQ